MGASGAISIRATILPAVRTNNCSARHKMKFRQRAATGLDQADMARTRAADFEEKQRSILKTAASTFAELGIDRASMAQIASRSGVSKALLYHYYPSKDALIFDIVHTHLSELDDALAQADDANLPAETRLRLIVGQLLEHYRNADNYHQVQLTGKNVLPQEMTDQLRAIERSIVARFSTLLNAINPKLDGETPLLMPVTMSLLGMMNWMYMWFRPNGPISRDAYADIVTRLIIAGSKSLV
jgi:AcrR family transcriptional regulator